MFRAYGPSLVQQVRCQTSVTFGFGRRTSCDRYLVIKQQFRSLDVDLFLGQWRFKGTDFTQVRLSWAITSQGHKDDIVREESPIEIELRIVGFEQVDANAEVIGYLK